MPLSGRFSYRGKLVFLCLGDMASERNVHCNLMLHPSALPSFPPRPSPSLFFHPCLSVRRWVLHSHLVTAYRRLTAGLRIAAKSVPRLQNIPLKMMSWLIHLIADYIETALYTLQLDVCALILLLYNLTMYFIIKQTRKNPRPYLVYGKL